MARVGALGLDPGPLASRPFQLEVMVGSVHLVQLASLA